MNPRPLQAGGPPIWIAGTGAAARARTARLGDGWHPLRVPPPELAEGLAEIKELARQEGRDPNSIGLSSVVGLPPDSARASERLIELGRSGVQHAVAVVTGDSLGDRCRAIEELATEVLPVVRRELGS